MAAFKIAAVVNVIAYASKMHPEFVLGGKAKNGTHDCHLLPHPDTLT